MYACLDGHSYFPSIGKIRTSDAFFLYIMPVCLNDVKSIWNMQEGTCTRGDVTVNRAASFCEPPKWKTKVISLHACHTFTQLYSTWCSAIVNKDSMHKFTCSHIHSHTHMLFPSSSWGQYHQFKLRLICSVQLLVLVLIKSNEAVAKLHLHNAAVTRKFPFCLFRFFQWWLSTFWMLLFHCFSFSTWYQYQSCKHWSIVILTRY